MSGPENKIPDDALQYPRSYPGTFEPGDDEYGVFFGPGSRRRSRTRKRADFYSEPGEELSLLERVTKKDIRPNVTFSPPFSGRTAPVPEGLHVTAAVHYVDRLGIERPWPTELIHVKYGRTTFDAGPGPFHIIPQFNDETWFVTVAIDMHVGGGRWKSVPIYRSKPVLAYCAVDMYSTDLDREAKDFIQTLYGEGGGMDAVSDEEIARVAWCMRTRVEFVRRVEADAAAAPDNEVFQARLEAVRRDFARAGTYRSALSHPGQFDAWEGKGWRMAEDPKAIREHYACTTLDRTRRIALDVMRDGGRWPNPDAGRGNRVFPGCFFYMTPDALSRFKKKNPTSKRWDYSRLPPLPATKTHPRPYHIYWPLKDEPPWTA